MKLIICLVDESKSIFSKKMLMKKVFLGEILPMIIYSYLFFIYQADLNGKYFIN